MRIRKSRQLRTKRATKPTPTPEQKTDPMAGFQTVSGFSTIERRASRYESWDGQYRETPIIMGFRPNQENTK